MPSPSASLVSAARCASACVAYCEHVAALAETGSSAIEISTATASSVVLTSILLQHDRSTRELIVLGPCP